MTLKSIIMKKNYYLFMLLTFLSVNLIQAQFVCPELLGSQSTTTTIHFKIVDGSSCNSFPQNIFVSYQGFSETFGKSSCSGTDLFYTTSGSALPVADSFATFFPGRGTCNYVDGVLQTLSEEEVSLNEKILLYPNPVTNGDNLTIKFKSNLSAKLEMYNVTGKLVFVDEVSNQDSKVVDTNNLSNGIYMLKISSDNASTTRKVVIMK